MANDLYTNFVDSFRTQCQEPAFGGDNSRMSTRSGMGARTAFRKNLCAPYKTECNILFVLPEDSFVHRESYRLLHFDENKR